MIILLRWRSWNGNLKGKAKGTGKACLHAMKDYVALADEIDILRDKKT